MVKSILIVSQYSYNQFQWFDLQRGKVVEIIVNSSIPEGTLSSSFNSKLFIRLKYTSLDYVYSHHPDYISASAGRGAENYHPYHTPYEDHIHSFYLGIVSHVLSDTETFISLDSYKTNARYYGGGNIPLYLLDFETGLLRDTMLSNNLYRMFIYLARAGAGVSSQLD